MIDVNGTRSSGALMVVHHHAPVSQPERHPLYTSRQCVQVSRVLVQRVASRAFISAWSWLLALVALVESIEFPAAAKQP